MNKKCVEYIEPYINFLSKSFTVESTKNGCIIYTPFIGFDGDPISFYIKDIGKGKLELRDMGETLSYLEMFNIDIVRGKNKDIFSDILSLYNVKESNKEIFVQTSKKTIENDMNNYIIALQSILHLEYRKTSGKASDFHVIAHQYCEANDIPHNYQKEIIAKGRHFIDLTSKDEKTLVQTIGTVQETPSQIKRHTEFKLFPFLELKFLKRKEYTVSMIDNNVGGDSDSMVFIENYSDDYFDWTKRKRLADVLSN